LAARRIRRSRGKWKKVRILDQVEVTEMKGCVVALSLSSVLAYIPTISI
jgi:hypothetical protein